MITIWVCCSCCSLIAFEIVQQQLCLQLLPGTRLIWNSGNQMLDRKCHHHNEWEGFNFQANIEILCVLCAREFTLRSPFSQKKGVFNFFKRFLGTNFFFITVFGYSCSVLYILLQVHSILKWTDYILIVIRTADIDKWQIKCAPHMYWFVPQKTDNFDAKFHICTNVISWYESRVWSLIFYCRWRMRVQV